MARRHTVQRVYRYIINSKAATVILYFSVVQNRITAYWFKNKELALAFGICLAFSRLGSVLNFITTQNFESSYGLTWTLWGGRYQKS